MLLLWSITSTCSEFVPAHHGKKCSSMTMQELQDELLVQDPSDSYPYKKSWPRTKEIVTCLIEQHHQHPDALWVAGHENVQARTFEMADGEFLDYVLKKGSEKLICLGTWDRFVSGLEPASVQLLFDRGADPCQNEGMATGGCLDWIMARFICCSASNIADTERVRVAGERQRLIAVAEVLVSNGAPFDGTPGVNYCFYELSFLQNLLGKIEVKKMKQQPIEDCQKMVATVQETARKRKAMIEQEVVKFLPVRLIPYVIGYDGQTKSEYTQEEIAEFSKRYLKEHWRH